MSAMFAPQNKAAEFARRLAASALALWLAGVGCFLVCEIGASAAPVDEHQAAAENSCPNSSGHDCCQKAEGNNDGSTARQTSGETAGDDCCLLPGQTAGLVIKVSNSDAPTAAAGDGPKVALSTHTFKQLTSHPAQVPDRGSTHLRCCVFLI